MKHPSGEEARIILDSIADGVFTVDLNWVITYFNRSAEKIIGIGRGEAVGRSCCEIFRSNICERSCSLRRTLETGRPVLNSAIFITTLDDRQLPISISTALLRDKKGRVVGGVETFRDLSVEQHLRRELTGAHAWDAITGKDRKMRHLAANLKTVAEKDVPVLLLGEPGTEKEVFAQTLHSLSHRSRGPFVAFRCGSLPEALMESELFGYASESDGKTGRGKTGRVKKASDGTLFLDEIDRLSLKLQERIVRLLRDNVYEPVGSRQSEKADVRIVAAACKSLSDPAGPRAVCRELQDQIGAVTLRIPPLRERKEDIPLLTGHLIEKFNSLNGKQIDGPSQEALAVLMAYDFPGNNRELERIVEYAHVICPDRYLQVQHLPDNLDRRAAGFPSPALARVSAADSLMAVERNFIYKSLMRNAWNRKATAEEMGIHPTTLWRKMKRHNIEKPMRPRRRAKK